MKKNIGSQIKGSFTNRRFKNGIYSTFLTVIIVVIAIFANLFIKELDLKLDFSQEKTYTLTKQTHTIVNELNNQISLYYMVQSGNEIDMLKEVLNKYKSLSENISVEKIDPVLYPQFTSKYIKEDVMENSVIVVNNNTQVSKYISYQNMFLYNTDYNTLQSTITAIDIEGQISSAIQYVTTKDEDLSVLYQIEGHGEGSLSSMLLTSIEKLNFKVDTLKTISTKKIPKDCDILLINGPTNDFSKEEIRMIKTYLTDGGKAIIFAGATENKMTNFNQLLSYYGITLEQGIVAESQGHYLGQYPNYLIANLEEHEITNSISEKKIPIIMPESRGLLIDKKLRSTLAFEPLLTTSDEAYSKIKEEWETVLKEKGDISGPFTTGVTVTENYKDKETKLVIYSSPYSLDLNEDTILSEQFGNKDLLLNSINWITERETGLSIPTKSVTQKYLNVTLSQLIFWSILLIGIIPACILIMGSIVWFRRRRC